MVIQIFSTLSGIILLYFGAEMLVRGSVSLSRRFRVTPLLVGLIVIGLGTSSPELVVSLNAALTGSGEIAVGNIVGSNISNLAMILGFGALIHPITAGKSLIKRELPVLLVATLMMSWLIADNMLSRLDSILLLAALLVYLVVTIRSNQKPAFAESEPGFIRIRTASVALVTVAGIMILLLGAHLMVSGASGLARTFNIGEGIIGLSVVAIGTSLPELATVGVAAIRKQGELILGSLIGSNILNILFVLGVTGLANPVTLTDIIAIDLILMTGLAVLMLPIIRTGYVVSRMEGGFLLAAYIGYLTYLFIR